MLYIFDKALYQNQLFMPYEFYLLIIMPLVIFGIPYISEKILFLIYSNKDSLTDYRADKVRSSTQLISCLLGMGIMIVCWNPDINTRYANSIKKHVKPIEVSSYTAPMTIKNKDELMHYINKAEPEKDFYIASENVFITEEDKKVYDVTMKEYRLELSDDADFLTKLFIHPNVKQEGFTLKFITEIK